MAFDFGNVLSPEGCLSLSPRKTQQHNIFNVVVRTQMAFPSRPGNNLLPIDIDAGDSID